MPTLKDEKPKLRPTAYKYDFLNLIWDLFWPLFTQLSYNKSVETRCDSDFQISSLKYWLAMISINHQIDSLIFIKDKNLSGKMLLDIDQPCPPNNQGWVSAQNLSYFFLKKLILSALKSALQGNCGELPSDLHNVSSIIWLDQTVHGSRQWQLKSTKPSIKPWLYQWPNKKTNCAYLLLSV